MSAPEPAVPSYGAVFIYGDQLRDLEGWEFRPASHLDFRAVEESDWAYYMRSVVEARPVQPKSVMVELPVEMVRYALDRHFEDADWSGLTEAFEQALRVCPACSGDRMVDAVSERDQLWPDARGPEGGPLVICPACGGDQ